MSRKSTISSKIESSRDTTAIAMVRASLFIAINIVWSMIEIQGIAQAGDVPSVTSMQRFVKPQTSHKPASEATQQRSDCIMPPDATAASPSSADTHPAEAQTTGPDESPRNAPRLLPTAMVSQRQQRSPSPPTIASATASAKHPIVLPSLPPERKSTRLPSTTKPTPEPKRLPTPISTAPQPPARLPASKAISEPTSPDFELWQPPGIFKSLDDIRARQGPEDDSGMIIDGEPGHLPALPMGAMNKPIGETMQVAYWEDELTPTAAAHSLSLVDRSVCPSMSWGHADDFSATPLPVAPWFHDADREQTVYDDKHPVPTQRPWIEWGRKFYGSGITPPSETWLGETNLVQQQLYLYGDYRSGIATGRNDFGRIDNWANRLNLDLDYRITATERFHAFFGPLNRATQFTHLARIGDDWDYQPFYNLNPVTAFFEGDAGALLGGAAGTPSPFELPITAGLVPLVFQNGIWMEDAASGFAFAIPARHSRLLNWANFDTTFFAVFDEINSPAFGLNNHAAQAFGTAFFIDAYGGYIEAGYAYLNDREQLGRSYHNTTASFTRRYFDKISNSVRIITNTGQDLPKEIRTADGALLLVENSLVTNEPLTVVPYCNLFAGWGRPQSVARAGVAGGVLRNTGINFEIDGLNGYPTLDAAGADTAGGAIGVDLIGDDLDRQWLLEAAYLTPHGDRTRVRGDQFALGTRYQVAISHRSIIRFDAMYGWEQRDDNIYGTRMEYRWKF